MLCFQGGPSGDHTLTEKAAKKMCTPQCSTPKFHLINLTSALSSQNNSETKCHPQEQKKMDQEGFSGYQLTFQVPKHGNNPFPSKIIYVFQQTTKQLAMQYQNFRKFEIPFMLLVFFFSIALINIFKAEI